MHIRVWVKAFIPDVLLSHSDQEITWQPSTGNEQSMSMLPLQPYVPSLTASYATDQRTFSNALDASARITTVVDIPLNGWNDNINIKRYSDPTLQLTKSWMQLFTFQDGSIDSLTSQPYGDQLISLSDDGMNISFTANGSNPFFTCWGVSYAPPIKMSFNLCIKIHENGYIDLSLQGKISEFPAFESYIQIDNAEPMTLFRHSPPKGNTPFNLVNGLTQNVNASIPIKSYLRNNLFISNISHRAASNDTDMDSAQASMSPSPAKTGSYLT